MLSALNAGIAAAVTARATLLINHVLSSEPVACGRLRSHAGRRLRIKLLDWPGLLPALPAFCFAITAAGLLEWQPEVDGAGPDSQVDLDITVEAGNPAALLLGGLVGQRPAVSISGDSSLAADVSWVIDNLRWDLRDDVARLVGEIPARELARQASAMAAGLRGLVQDVVQRAASVRGGVGGAAQSPSPAQRPAR